MLKFLTSVLFIPFIIFFIPDAMAQKSDSTWTLTKNKNDIELYVRFPEGSEIKEVLASCTFEAEVSDLVETVLEVEAYPDWVSNIKEAERLEETGENEYIFYYLANFPWPLKDRDVVLNTKLVKEGDTKTIYIKLEGIASYIPEKEDIIRIQHIHAYWSFIPEPSGMVRVSYQMLVDPGGGIPTWLINTFLIDGPYQNLYHLREFTEKNDR